MAGSTRKWRVTGLFRTVGDVTVWVTAPNWQGGVRKGALAIKALPAMKGKKIKGGSFSIQEVDEIPPQVSSDQLPLVEAVGTDGTEAGSGSGEPVGTGEPEEPGRNNQ